MKICQPHCVICVETTKDLLAALHYRVWLLLCDKRLQAKDVTTLLLAKLLCTSFAHVMGMVFYRL